MNVMKTIKHRFVITLLVALSGCAGTYHQYPYGCVSYGYSPPAPLPYGAYCGCPIPVAATYVGTNVAKPVVSDQWDADSDGGDSSSS